MARQVNRTAQMVLAMVVLSSALFVACGSDDESAAVTSVDPIDRGTPVAEVGQLAIYAAYVPAPPTDVAALYFVVVNEGSEPDRLLGVSSAGAGMAMLHQTVVDGDSSRMSMVDGGIEIPPGDEIVLEPGGYHVMLMSLVERLELGDTVPATLEFEVAGSVTIEAPVTDRSMEGSSQHEQ